MSDENKEKAVLKNNAEIKLPKSATDTSIWDNKVSTDPNGDKYIRSLDEENATN